MFNKIIWATDGSNAADLSLPHATTLAKDADGELLIVHCEQWIAPLAVPAGDRETKG